MNERQKVAGAKGVIKSLYDANKKIERQQKLISTLESQLAEKDKKIGELESELRKEKLK